MTDEPLTLQGRVAKGERARQLLESETFTDAVKRVKDKKLRKWELTKPEEGHIREECHMAVRLLAHVVQELRQEVQSGLTAVEKIKQQADEEAHEKRMKPYRKPVEQKRA